MTEVTYRQFTGSGAQNYERYFVPAIGGPVSVELVRSADLQPGEQVLDVGCGTGVIARRAAAAVGPTGSVTGIDIAPDMIEVAASLPVSGAPVTWRHGDAAALPFADETFDVVLGQMSLMFVEDRATAVGEMYRVLRPGGRVVITTPGAIQPAFELMERSIVEHISADLAGFVRMVFSMHDPSVHRDLLQGAGFDQIGARVYTATLDLPAPAEFLWQYINLTPMGPFVANATEAARAAMEAQVVDTWAPFVKNGRTPIDQPMVIASGARA